MVMWYIAEHCLKIQDMLVFWEMGSENDLVLQKACKPFSSEAHTMQSSIPGLLGAIYVQTGTQQDFFCD